MASNLISYDNPILLGFAFYVVLCILKMTVIQVLTSLSRTSNHVYSNPEDKFFSGFSKKAQVTFNDPSVERLRRNHLNDIENIPVFIFVGFFYVLTAPSAFYALWHFRVFTASRVLHSLAYQGAWPQPSRGTFYMVGLAVNLSMAVQTVLYLW